MEQREGRLVSIILPAYNVADYLDKCLESVTAQTYPNIEIIIVDDGSTDNTAKKSDTWAERDNRIHVLHQTNQGVSAARNIGIQYASGDYILTVDPDDLIDAQLVQSCMSSIDKENADLVFFAYCLIDEKDNIIKRVPIKSYCNMDLLKLVLQDRIQSHPWAFICDKKLYNGISFPVGRRAEDLATVYRVVAKAEKPLIKHDYFYLYRVRGNSVLGMAESNSEKAVHYFKDELLAFYEMIAWAKHTKCDDFVHMAQNNMIQHLFYHYKHLLALDDIRGADWIRMQIREESKSLSLHQMKPLNKIRVFMLKINLLSLYYRLNNLFKKTVKKILHKI